MGGKSYAYHNPNKSASKDEGDNCCSLSCLKFSLYIYNIVALVSGLCLLAVSLWILLDSEHAPYASFSSSYTLLAWAALGVGGAVIVSTVLGCCGISRESWQLVLLYASACGLLILLEVLGGLTAYFYRHEVQTELVRTLNVTFTQDYGFNNMSTVAVDIMQSRLHCCGAESFEDWRASAWLTSEWRPPNNRVPDSCCKTVSRNCGIRDHPSNIYYTGCSHSLATMLARHLFLLAMVAGGVAMIQISGLFLACQLARRLKNLPD